MSSTSKDSRQTTTQPPDRRAESEPGSEDGERPEDDANHSHIEEVSELPDEIAEAAEHVLEEIEEVAEYVVEEIDEVVEPVLEGLEDSAIGRRAVSAYVWFMARAPTSTRGRIIFIAGVFLIVLAPSLAMLYVSLDAGSEATESWFGDLGYFGVFLANLASTATLFVPVPALTAAAQALIVSSTNSLSPFWVGLAGGLGMAIGEMTAYVGGMAAAFIAKEEEIKPPGRLAPLIAAITKRVTWLMSRFGMITLYVLSAVPNIFFEVAGLTAGATRYPFKRFMVAVLAGKVTRGLLLAYIGEKIFFG